jgi:hypothetical protein
VRPGASAGDWAGDEGDAVHVVENYCTPFARPRPLGDSCVTQYHRPLDDYVRALLAAGFALDELRELAIRRRSPGRISVFVDARAVKRG